MLQNLFETFVQLNSSNIFLDLRIHRIQRLLNTCGIQLVGVIRVQELQKMQLWLRIQAIWKSLSQADSRNLFDSILYRIATFIAARGGYTKYCFWTLTFFSLKISSFICINTSRLCIKFHLILMIPSWCCIFYKQQCTKRRKK